MSVVWPRSRRETPPTPAPDIAAEVDGDMAATMAWFAAGLTAAAAACLPLAHITWAPAAAFTILAVWVAGAGCPRPEEGQPMTETPAVPPTPPRSLKPSPTRVGSRLLDWHGHTWRWSWTQDNWEYVRAVPDTGQDRMMRGDYPAPASGRTVAMEDLIPDMDAAICGVCSSDPALSSDDLCGPHRAKYEAWLVTEVAQSVPAEPSRDTVQDPDEKAFVDGWLAARATYGATDPQDVDHGAECPRAHGDHDCYCDEDAAREWAEQTWAERRALLGTDTTREEKR